jgi:hypothetical protein
MAWQKLAGEQLQVLIGARTNMTTEGTEAAVNEANGQYLRYQTAGAINSDAGWLPDNFARFSRENAPICDIIVELDSAIDDARIWCAMTNMDLMAASIPVVTNVMGFRCDTNFGDVNWQAITSDGALVTTVDTGIPLAIDTKYHLRIDAHKESGKIFFYINRILVATIDTFLPTLTTHMAPQVEVRKVLSTGSVKQIKIQKVAVEYNG